MLNWILYLIGSQWSWAIYGGRDVIEAFNIVDQPGSCILDSLELV